MNSAAGRRAGEIAREVVTAFVGSDLDLRNMVVTEAAREVQATGELEVSLIVGLAYIAALAVQGYAMATEIDPAEVWQLIATTLDEKGFP